MRRERELKLLRKKRLLKRYSDFELSLLASEMKDYTYLLKSIKFPKEELKIVENKENNDIKEIDKNKTELSSEKKVEESSKYKKLFSFGDKTNNLKASIIIHISANIMSIFLFKYNIYILLLSLINLIISTLILKKTLV